MLILAVAALLALTHALPAPHNATLAFAEFEVHNATLAFAEFEVRYTRTYSSPSERAVRMATFHVNLGIIADLNAQEGAEVYGTGPFSDIPAEEFRATHLGYVMPTNIVHNTTELDLLEQEEQESPAAAGTVDWRTKGKVTPVKDQQQCGSCWAFSTTEAVESAWLMAGNSQTILSPEELVSCDKADLGCDGGDTITAYKYVQKKGMVTEKTYPYSSGKGKTGKCKARETHPAVVHISGFKYATPPASSNKKPNENQMKQAMASKGPVSVCVDASTWQNYKKGVVTRSCKRDLDHCVQAVGYNSDATPPYWIVRNSWNTDWGYGGYIYVGMGGDHCGIADEATIVTI